MKHNNKLMDIGQPPIRRTAHGVVLNDDQTPTKKTKKSTPEEELPQLALSLGLRSYANQLACARVLDIIREKNPHGDRKHKADKDKE